MELSEELKALALRIADGMKGADLWEAPRGSNVWLIEFASRILEAVRGEPIAWMDSGDGELFSVSEQKKYQCGDTPLYLHPAPSQEARGEQTAAGQELPVTFQSPGRDAPATAEQVTQYPVPAAPNAQASTPLTDALSTEKHIGRKVFQDTRIWKLSRNLERKLAAAQAQIKLATNFIVNFSGNSLGGGDQPVQFLCSSYALVVNQNKALKAQIEEFERTLAAPAAEQDGDWVGIEGYRIAHRAMTAQIADLTYKLLAANNTIAAARAALGGKGVE